MLEGTVLSTRLTYLDIGSPVFHSLDIYSAAGTGPVGWFELPTYPDMRVKDVRFDVAVPSLEARSWVDGQEMPRAFSARPLVDGNYVAHFSVWSGTTVVKRIPLYRFSMQDGHISGFQPFPLKALWKIDTEPGG